MEKEIFIKTIKEEECCGGHGHQEKEECCGGHGHGHQEKEECCGGHGEKHHHERPHHEHGFDKKRHKVIKVDLGGHRGMSKTKMFTDKEAMVNYVNEIGELGHHVDIFKIEESLYKVVVHERPKFKTEK